MAEKITNVDEYQKLAQRTNNSTDFQRDLLNGALGLNGEAGEVADIIKKWQFQGHAIDPDKIAEELSDICWYIAIMAKALNYDFSEILYINIDKLMKRYPKGFDADRSIHRDKR